VENPEPTTLSAAVREHVEASGRSPCAFGIAMSRVPAKRWNTRADLYECLKQAREVLDLHFSEPIPLRTLAANVGVSPFHFQRLFREFFGVSPNEHVRRRRLERAKALIESGTGVTEACYEVGFLSPSTFTRYFRREFGLSPREVRSGLSA